MDYWMFLRYEGQVWDTKWDVSGIAVRTVPYLLLTASNETYALQGKIFVDYIDGFRIPFEKIGVSAGSYYFDIASEDRPIFLNKAIAHRPKSEKHAAADTIYGVFAYYGRSFLKRHFRQ